MWPNNIKVCLLLTVFFNSLSASQAIPLLILKVSHSGSSWFTSMLNIRKGVFITEEVFGDPDWTLQYIRKRNDLNPPTVFNTSTAYLSEALRHPMKTFPIGEYRNYSRDLVVVRASLGVDIGYWVNLDGLTKIVPDMRVLLWVRTNKIKHVISLFRAISLKKKCGDVVITGHCRLTNKTVVNLQEFDDVLIRILANDKIMTDWAMFLRKDIEHSHFKRLSYEEAVGDEFIFESLLEWAVASPEPLKLRSEANIGRCRHGCSKNTPYDLREVVENYEELEMWIRFNYPLKFKFRDFILTRT